MTLNSVRLTAALESHTLNLPRRAPDGNKVAVHVKPMRWRKMRPTTIPIMAAAATRRVPAAVSHAAEPVYPLRVSANGI